MLKRNTIVLEFSLHINPDRAVHLNCIMDCIRFELATSCAQCLSGSKADIRAKATSTGLGQITRIESRQIS
jgi:hypothetical protein